MDKAKIVVGANFGDEGKGLMTDYFAHEAKCLRQHCLVVCHNGGSQKGHTVVSPSGLRHVFHHFGSGAFSQADTYLSPLYIVNPITFNMELGELEGKGAVTRTYVNKKCRLTTPFDMMVNQMAEECRGDGRHGSCGLGIYETVVRAGASGGGATVGEYAVWSDADIRAKLGEIAERYLPYRVRQLGIEEIPAKWVEILSGSDRIIENFIADFRIMMENVETADNDIIDDFPYVIFEGAQGLLLDQDNIPYMPHLTPSNTGIQNPVEIIGGRAAEIEVCYVTRTYMTRHGAGRFDTECKKEDINPEILDLTNVPNPYQDSLRYGTLDLHDLKTRMEGDLRRGDMGRGILKSVAFTHCDELGLDSAVRGSLFDGYKVYESYGVTREDVTSFMRKNGGAE